MSESARPDAYYLLGHSEEETKRLQKQAKLYNPSTRRLFMEAGIREGMKVLDVGSGAGDVALLLAELVGQDGAIVGVDRNPIILETAQKRAYEAGLTNISFIAGNICSVTLDNDFDAVVGRNVLLYIGDPSAALRSAISHLRSGGPVAFQEVDFSLSERTYGNIATPRLFRQWGMWVVEAFRHARAELQMGFKLPKVFLDAGLPLPQMYMDGIAGVGPDWGGYDYCADTLRSILPTLLDYGIATAEEVDIPTFAERMREEVVHQNGAVLLFLMMSAWANKV